MSTDRTKAACERLFDLMSIEAVPYRREPAIVTPRPSWMSSYAAMFAHPAQMLDDGDAA